jgi:hypothetical protein
MFAGFFRFLFDLVEAFKTRSYDKEDIGAHDQHQIAINWCDGVFIFSSFGYPVLSEADRER